MNRVLVLLLVMVSWIIVFLMGLVSAKQDHDQMRTEISRLTSENRAYKRANESAEFELWVCKQGGEIVTRGEK